MLLAAQSVSRPSTRISRGHALMCSNARFRPQIQSARRYATLAEIQTAMTDVSSQEDQTLRKVLRSFRLETKGNTEELRARVAEALSQIENPFEISYKAEETYLLLEVPHVAADEVDRAQVAVRKAKDKGRKPSAADCEAIFYFYAKKRDTPRMEVAYLDHKEVGPSPVLMLQLLMIEAGKLGDAKLARSVLEEFQQQKYYKWPPVSVDVCLKTLSTIANMPSMLYVYEKLFEHGNLPQKEHWILMLRGAARAADVKHFSRFYHRLESKGHKLYKPHLKELLKDWGVHEDNNWKHSKACHTQVIDYVFMVDIAQRARNYKLAIEFLKEVLQLDKQPTYQLYEMFVTGVQRDIPRFQPSGRDLKLKWKETHGPVDKPTIALMNAWVKEVVDFVGEDSLEDLPPQAMAPKPRLKQTRKQRAIENGYERKRVRYVSKHSDPNKLFEFVPYYARRLEREKKEAERKSKKATLETEIDAEIEKAGAKKKAWYGMGFEGNFPVESKHKMYELLQLRLMEIKDHNDGTIASDALYAKERGRKKEKEGEEDEEEDEGEDLGAEFPEGEEGKEDGEGEWKWDEEGKWEEKEVKETVVEQRGPEKRWVAKKKEKKEEEEEALLEEEEDPEAAEQEDVQWLKAQQGAEKAKEERERKKEAERRAQAAERAEEDEDAREVRELGETEVKDEDLKDMREVEPEAASGEYEGPVLSEESVDQPMTRGQVRKLKKRMARKGGFDLDGF